MPGHSFYQPLKNNCGVTLIEATMAIALSALVIAVIVGLFAAGIKSFTYSLRETAALTNARQALDSGGGFPGMAWQARRAVSSSGLSASQLSLTTPAGQVPQYTMSGTSLQMTQTGQTQILANNITSLQVKYYNVDATGLIMVSTNAASASLVTTWMQSQQSNRKTYTFFSAARLRNHS